MKSRMIFIAVILCSAFLMACIRYSVSPPDKTVNLNDTFSVDIKLNNCLGPVEILGVTMPWEYCADTSDVYGVGFDLNYDDTIIEFQSVDISSSVLSGATVATGFRNSATENGNLVVGISKQGQVAGEEGKGIIATIEFQAIGAGDTDITFADPHLLNDQAESYVGWPFYWARLRKGSVEVSP